MENITTKQLDEKIEALKEMFVNELQQINKRLASCEQSQRNFQVTIQQLEKKIEEAGGLG